MSTKTADAPVKSALDSYRESQGLKTTTAAGGNAIYPDMGIGSFVDAVYLKIVERPKPDRKAQRMIFFRLNGQQGPIKWMRGKAELPAGESVTEFTMSAQVLDTALEGRAPGTRVLIEFQGIGKAKGGNNAPKLYRVEVVE